MTAFDFRSAGPLGLSLRQQVSSARAGEAGQRRRAEVNATGALGATAALLSADRQTLLDGALARRGI